MPINPQSLAAALWVLLFLFYLKGPPKGPSAQEVQRAFPFYHQEARV